MTGGQLNANVDQYLQAAAMNTPPPHIVSDPLVTGVTPIEQLLRVLGLAANLGDSQDNADSAAEHARRDAKATEAAEKFAAQDEEAARELNSVAGQTDPLDTPDGAQSAKQAAGLTQQLPQAVSSIAGALSGALGGALQPLAQIPQQIAQGAQQAMQSGMGLLQQAASPVADGDLTSVPLDELGSIPEDFATLGYDGSGGFGDMGGGADLGTGDLGGGGGAGLGSGLPSVTAPTSMLGPPPVPSASTAPSSSPASRIIPPIAPPSAPSATPGMAGMPMVPPGSMAGAHGSEKDAKADTRRVSVPPVRNGAPVQGRLTTPPALPPVTRKVDGAPAVTRRVVGPAGKTGSTSDDDAAGR